MNSDKKKTLMNAIHGISLVGILFGMIISSFNVLAISLTALCLVGNYSLVYTFKEKVKSLSITNELLKRGVFDSVIDIPEDMVDEVKIVSSER